jgi:hypothetical protein
MHLGWCCAKQIMLCLPSMAAGNSLFAKSTLRTRRQTLCSDSGSQLILRRASRLARKVYRKEASNMLACWRTEVGMQRWIVSWEGLMRCYNEWWQCSSHSSHPTSVHSCQSACLGPSTQKSCVCLSLRIKSWWLFGYLWARVSFKSELGVKLFG